jgi:hypothetical protein
MSTPVAAILSAIVGVALELVVHAVSGRDEAWDSDIFWTAGLPAAMVASFGIGLLSKGRAWLGTLAVAPGQFATMSFRLGEIGTLWPLGLALSAILSAPFVASAFAGSKLRRRFSR